MTYESDFNYKDHNFDSGQDIPGILYEKKPVLGSDGQAVNGLFNIWITLDNPAQYNSYTTEMVKGAILAFRKASNERDSVAVVFTGSGDRAFCTGGNTKEYAEYYAGRPQEYRQYMRLFNDMVSSILACDKPVVCRVNGMRLGGGQEIGMACDFSIAQDLARFGQAGPKHGSAPIGGSTDFLPVMMTGEKAMESGTLCEVWSAHKVYLNGMISGIVDIGDARNVFLDHHLHPLLQGHIDHSASLASSTEFKVGTVFLDLKKPDHSSVSSYQGIHLVLQNMRTRRSPDVGSC